MRNTGVEKSLKLNRTVPIRCPKCRKMVFWVRNNGGSVWVDELGWPWPEHPCFQSNLNQSVALPEKAELTVPFYEDYDRIARFSKRCEFCDATIKFCRYAIHVEHCSERRKFKSEPRAHRSGKEVKRAQRMGSPDRQILTRCETCTAVVKPSRYARHLRKVHETTVAVPAKVWGGR